MKIISVVIMVLFCLSNIQANIHTKCVSHRGLDLSKKISVEHSLNSFRRVVLKSGARHVEFDVRHTSDFIPIVVHDVNLKRVAISKIKKRCPLKTKISDLRYSQIKENCQLKDASSIPTMTEVLLFLSKHQVHSFVELKDTPHESTAFVLFKYSKNIPITVISFKEKFLEKMKHIFQSKNLPMQNIEYMPIKIEDIHTINKTYSGIDLSVASQSVVNKWHSLGKKIGVWTINDNVQINKYLQMGVDYITTDQLSRCSQLAATFN